jgi:glutamyl-tRNA synthetase
VIRFRNPDNGVVAVDDLIRGRVLFNNEELDDLIIRRSDGSPTYNLTVVVDDMDMHITHVIRGDDHLNNTPKQINILRAIGAQLPLYGHVPMILGDDGSRLSKRHGAVSVMQYREEGFLPEALLNYLVRLGWSHGDQEVFSIDEMIELFDIDAVNKAASSFNTEKLLWLNQQYIIKDDAKRIAHLLSPHMGDLGIDPAAGPDLVEVAKAHQERARTLVEMAQMVSFCYKDYDEFDEAAAKKHLRGAAREPLQRLRAVLESLGEWDDASLHAAVQQVTEELGLKMGKVAQPLRVAVVGRAASPGIDVTLRLVGKTATLRRIDRALEYIRQREANAG